MPYASYDLIAPEYYDENLHPTCRNFGELSESFIRRHIISFLDRKSWMLDVGAGRSVLAPISIEAGTHLDHLIIMDNSGAMLAHSHRWGILGAKLIVGDAQAVPLQDESIDVLVASLGDPYNSPLFWIEVARLLTRTGICLFTAPSFEWATRFRSASVADHAEFVVGGDSAVAVPSHILPVEKQIAMVFSAGLQVIDFTGHPASDLASPRSQKLDVLGDRIDDTPVVRGFVVTRQ